MFAPVEPAVVVAVREGLPALPALAQDEGLGRFALCIERVEVLVQTLLGRLAGVDGAR